MVFVLSQLPLHLFHFDHKIVIHMHNYRNPSIILSGFAWSVRNSFGMTDICNHIVLYFKFSYICILFLKLSFSLCPLNKNKWMLGLKRSFVWKLDINGIEPLDTKRSLPNLFYYKSNSSYIYIKLSLLIFQKKKKNKVIRKGLSSYALLLNICDTSWFDYSESLDHFGGFNSLFLIQSQSPIW